MTQPEFLEPDVVLFLHDQVLGEYGGIQGIKSEDLLHSALGRRVNKRLYADPGTPRTFATLPRPTPTTWPATTRSTKATSAPPEVAACCFLKLNGIELSAPATAVIEQVVRLATGHLPEPEFAAWLRSCFVPSLDPG